VNVPGLAPAVVAVAVVLFVLLLLAVGSLLGYRRRLHDVLGRGRGDPIPTVKLGAFHPRFASDELGPTLEAEVAFIGGGDGVPHGTSDREAWVLAVLAREARLLFEFGTATGRTAYLWARNAPPGATVVTLTLPPDQVAAYEAEPGDSRGGTRRALEESAYARFRYSGTQVEGRVRQLFGDSKAFDETPYAGSCDLIFVDGSHALSYVESDSEKALRMLSPEGILLWHDYRSRWAKSRDVYRYLNELAEKLPLVRLAGTSLVAYRRTPPVASAPPSGGASPGSS